MVTNTVKELKGRQCTEKYPKKKKKKKKKANEVVTKDQVLENKSL